MIGLTGVLDAGTYRLGQINAIGLRLLKINIGWITSLNVGLSGTDMKNSHNLVRCKCCNALYDQTIKWVRGYYQGTSSNFTTTGSVKESSCPVCGKENQ